MRILIDISHPAHANFFKFAAKHLINNNHIVIISVLNRGRLLKIVKEEYKNFQIISSGNYKPGTWGIIFHANFLRFFTQIFNVYKYKIDIGLSCGSFTFGAAMNLRMKPNYQFDDDPERKINLLLERLTATKILFPPIIQPSKNITTYNALKEWAYLSPRYFSPNPKALGRYALEPGNYFFVREIQSKSLNYRDQKEGLIAQISKDLPTSVKYLLSVEDKALIEQYPHNWIILKEPVSNIHSLIYYSAGVLSSGDSMAREGAMLGVPSIYCGNREMKANEFIQQYGSFQKVTANQIPFTINQLIKKRINVPDQESYRKHLSETWDDVNELILGLIKEKI